LVFLSRDRRPLRPLAGEVLLQYAAPVSVSRFRGERDEFLSIDAVGQPLADLLGARLVKLPGAHFTPLDCPAEVALELCNFLGRFRSEP
jgi:pimeloyl-ACP methyl ester carboxylesterase